MRNLMLCFLLGLLVSCGKDKGEGPEDPTPYKSRFVGLSFSDQDIQSLNGETEIKTASIVCQALKDKEKLFKDNNFIGTSFRYDYTFSDCTSENVREVGEIRATLAEDAQNNLFFQYFINEAQLYKTFVSTKSSPFLELCPGILAGGTANATGINGNQVVKINFASLGGNQYIVRAHTGRQQQGGPNYMIVKEDVYVFNLQNEQTKGLTATRATYEACAGTSRQIQKAARAVLKGIQ